MSESKDKPQDSEKFNDYLREVEIWTRNGVSGIIGNVEDRILDEEMRQMYFDFRQPGKHFTELQGRVTATDLKQLLYHLDRIDTDDSDGAFDYAALAADLKEFDPSWFEENYRGIGLRWNELMEAPYILKDNPLKFLEYLCNLKTLDSEGFSRDIKIDSKMWDKIAQAIKDKVHIWDDFIKHYARAAFLNYREIASRINLDKYWDEIRIKLDSYFPDSLSYACMTADAQPLKPSGENKISFPSKEWLACKHKLFSFLKTDRGYDNLEKLKTFIAYARALKYLEIDESENEN